MTLQNKFKSRDYKHYIVLYEEVYGLIRLPTLEPSFH